MNWSPERLSLWFAALGHAFMHMFAAFYFTIVLALEDVWALPYHELIALWTPAAVLIGVIALPAGWLADRWGAAGMIAAGFVGMGATAILAGFADGTTSLMLALAGVGVFAAIYHPVGFPWIMRVAHLRPGQALAVNGVAGGIGAALAALVAGGLIDTIGWRGAFLVPGVASIAVGGAMFALLVAGRIADPREAAKVRGAAPSTTDRLRGFAILVVTMFTIGLVYHVTQVAAPKLIEIRMGELIGSGTFRIGALVFLVYFVSSFAQLGGGWLADRWPLVWVYLLGWLVMLPMLVAMTLVGGWPLLIVAMVLTAGGTGAIPAESMLLARYAPARHQSLAFGVKFVLALGALPIANELVAFAQRTTGEFSALYYGLAGLATLGLVLTLILPRDAADTRTGLPAPAAAAE